MAFCNVVLLRMKLSEAVFTTIAMQPGFTLQAHYASVVLANTAAPLITWCTDVSMSIVLHGDWQRSLGTTTKLGPAVFWTQSQNHSDLATKLPMG